MKMHIDDTPHVNCRFLLFPRSMIVFCDMVFAARGRRSELLSIWGNYFFSIFVNAKVLCKDQQAHDQAEKACLII